MDPWERLYEIAQQVLSRTGSYDEEKSVQSRGSAAAAAQHEVRWSKVEILAVISHMKGELDHLEQRLHESVERARDEGASWTEVGRALGVSKQAALQRFGRRQAGPEDS